MKYEGEGGDVKLTSFQEETTFRNSILIKVNIAKKQFSVYCPFFTNLRHFQNVLPNSVNLVLLKSYCQIEHHFITFSRTEEMKLKKMAMSFLNFLFKRATKWIFSN